MMADSIIIPSVSLVNNRPAVSSLKIAEHFGKRHDHVMRDINRIIGECADPNFGGSEFTAVNFDASEYTDSTGRTLPMYNVFQDGFVLLVMGYTGKQALQIKLVYIAAFNAMRDELAGRVQSEPTPALPDARLSTRKDPERKELTAAISAWVGCTPIHYAGARKIVNAHFRVRSVDALTVAQIRDAIAFVYAKIAEAAQTQKALPEARKALPPSTCSERDAALRLKALNPPPGLSGEYYEDELSRVYQNFTAWRRGVLESMEAQQREFIRVTGLLHRDVLHKIIKDTPLYMTDIGMWAMNDSRDDVLKAIRDGFQAWDCLFTKAKWFAKALRVNW